jgi:prepilin-type N-terminal cleavage/methylation domain-containing protein
MARYRKPPGRRLQLQVLADASGWTLLELLVAMAVLSVTAMLAVSSILVGDRISAQHVANADKTQQLRSATKMMADDLVYAQWDTSCSTPPGFSDIVPPVTDYVRYVAGYVVPDPPESSDPSIPQDAVWPGAWSQVNWGRVCVYYGIEGDSLIRETYRTANRYSRRTVLTGLGPDSHIEVIQSGGGVSASQMIRVTLQLEKEGHPGEYFEVTTEFFVPGPVG